MANPSALSCCTLFPIKLIRTKHDRFRAVTQKTETERGKTELEIQLTCLGQHVQGPMFTSQFWKERKDSEDGRVLRAEVMDLAVFLSHAGAGTKSLRLL